MALKISRMGASFGERPAGQRGAAGKSKDSDEDMQKKKKNAGSEQEKEQREKKKTQTICDDLVLQTRRGSARKCCFSLRAFICTIKT